MKKSIIAVLAVVVILTATAIPVGASGVSDEGTKMYSTSFYDTMTFGVHHENKNSIDVEYDFPNTTYSNDKTDTFYLSYVWEDKQGEYANTYNEWTIKGTKIVNSQSTIAGSRNYYKAETEMTIPNDLSYSNEGKYGYRIILKSDIPHYAYKEDFDLHEPTIKFNVDGQLLVSTSLVIDYYDGGNTPETINKVYMEMTPSLYIDGISEYTSNEEIRLLNYWENDLREILNENNIISVSITTDISIYDIETSDDVTMTINEYYRETQPTAKEMFLNKYTQGLNLIQPPVEVKIDGGIVSWLSNTLSRFMNTEILPNISIGSITWFCLGLGCVFAIIKMFGK